MSSEELIVSDLGEHMGTKGMWAGGLDPMITPNLLGAIPAAPATPSADESDAESDTASVASGESASEAAGLAGGVAVVQSPITIVEITRPHTPALLKAIDEIIGNATDRDGDIEISFDPATGRIIVLNHGSCVPIVEHAAQSAALGRPVYVPELAFGHPLAGTNIKKAHSSVKGGTNGIGARNLFARG